MRNRYRFNIKGDLLRATKGKIIFGFLMAILALIAAWGVSKLVFDEIIETVDQVSKPDSKLVLVNRIFNSVSRLDQKQKYLAIEKDGDNAFISETRAIKLSLDTLRRLYARDSAQLQRIKSIEKLLGKRDQQFILYLTVRDSLLNTNSFSKEIEKLNSIFAERAFLSDSAIYTTESKTSTTTLKDDGKSGFFNKIFGKRKSDSYKVVSEELKIKKDTLDQFVEDSILRNMESSLNKIKNKQKLKSNKFIAKERSLANASNTLTQQMLQVLEEVRNEALMQVTKKGITARTIVNKGINQITIILIVFFILTVFLSYFILRDIGKSNRYRQALEKAKELADYNARAKQRFLSNMSHEIRTPLQSIVGYSEIIQKTAEPDKKAVDAIHFSATHLLYIINEILDYSRIASGKFNLKSEVFDPEDLINEVLLILKPLALEKNLALIAEVNLNKQLWLKGDAFRLKQILYNLLGNAIKFTNAGSVKLSVDVVKTLEKAVLNLKIIDTGIGINEVNLASIFEEFDNGNHTENLNFNSTGLGLSIVKQLVDLHDGEITVESKLGQGSTFELRLNYEAVAMDNVKLISPPIASIKKYTNKKVWIVDDDQLILDLCGLILTQNHVVYQTFNKPKDLLENPLPPDLGYVLMDMRMPEIDGLALFKLVKEKVPSNVKFYAITAQVLPAEQQQILNTGFNGIINKPFTSENLLNILIDCTAEFENFNTESLRKMTFGDQNQLIKILKRFVEDSSSDIELLQAEIINRDFNLCRLIVHRLAGRTGQIGYKGLAHQFRKTEQMLQNEQSFTEDLIAIITEQVQQLKQFTDYLKENNYSI
ncbi:ATP-binding protein [Pedobacter arcticus]|uniref:ATP-binding protein n=1 Tax=Pedobacter arcticus TaxID=752140 RepID=UPI0002E77DBB|nr:ATP-binding protein [Pedobacter arcticus]